MSRAARLLIGQSDTSDRQAVRERQVDALGYAAVMALGLVLVVLAGRHFAQGFSIALALLLVTASSWVIAPTVGLHLTVFFALAGDTLSIAWFPFNKNLSSEESLLFVSDAVTTSPLELTLAVALTCWAVRTLADRQRSAPPRPLLIPFLVFGLFVALGLVHGIGRGGDLRIALIESRGLVYLPIVYLLVTDVCRTAEQYRRLMWTVVLGVVAHALLSLRYLASLSPAARDALKSLGEHGATVPMDALFVLLIASCVFVGSSAGARLGLALASVPVLWVYIVAQRRAAVIGLAVGVLMIVVALAWRQRGTFWRFTPACVALTAAYTAAFWNTADGIGFGAQALKVVLSPSAQTEVDKQSDLYRVIENFDLNFTIRQSPVTGLGFGQAFYRPQPLPDIGSLDLFRYMPHNSMLWIWIKMGFFGFVATLYLIARALLLGASRLRRLVDGRDVAVVLTATAIVAMYTVYAFVDIAWDARNMVLLGIAMAICAGFPVPVPPDLVPAHDELAEIGAA